jgi:hypothetical protein
MQIIVTLLLWLLDRIQIVTEKHILNLIENALISIFGPNIVCALPK